MYIVLCKVHYTVHTLDYSFSNVSVLKLLDSGQQAIRALRESQVPWNLLDFFKQKEWWRRRKSKTNVSLIQWGISQGYVPNPVWLKVWLSAPASSPVGVIDCCEQLEFIVKYLVFFVTIRVTQVHWLCCCRVIPCKNWKKKGQRQKVAILWINMKEYRVLRCFLPF